jgi:hypothetical protein
VSEKMPLLHRMLGDRLNGPPEWENAAAKVKFVTLRVGVADGTVWAVNILGKPLRPLGPLAGAHAAISDPVTRRSKAGMAELAAGLVADNALMIFGSRAKVTKWQATVTIGGQVAAANTIQSLSLAKDALKQVSEFNRLSGAGS